MFCYDILFLSLFIYLLAFVGKTSRSLSKDTLRRRERGVMRNKCATAHGLGRLTSHAGVYMLMLKGITGNNPLVLMEEECFFP